MSLIVKKRSMLASHVRKLCGGWWVLVRFLYIVGFRYSMALLLCHCRLFFHTQKSPADTIFLHFSKFGMYFWQTITPLIRNIILCCIRCAASPNEFKLGNGLFMLRDGYGQPLVSIYTWDPNDPCFGWKRPCFGGLTCKNSGHLGSRYICWVSNLRSSEACMARFHQGFLTAQFGVHHFRTNRYHG